jgi:hypothetical protein
LACIAIAAPLCLSAGASARTRVPRPCKLLTLHLAQELAQVGAPPTVNSIDDCVYTDHKPPGESRWMASLEIPLRLPGETGATLYKNEHETFLRGPGPTVHPVARSISGAEKAFYVQSTNETALAGPSRRIHIAWLKHNVFGRLDVETPEENPVTPPEITRVLRTLLHGIR